MKYLVLIPDGMADRPVEALGLNKLFSYWEPQTCIPRKAEELTFEFCGAEDDS